MDVLGIIISFLVGTGMLLAGFGVLDKTSFWENQFTARANTDRNLTRFMYKIIGITLILTSLLIVFYNYFGL
jgi:uncharacterized membrane protein